MGMLVNGKWVDQRPAEVAGRFVRPESQFRRFVTADGSSGFKAEPGRYHLYVSYNCPWAHRTIIFRRLKGVAFFIRYLADNVFAGGAVSHCLVYFTRLL